MAHKLRMTIGPLAALLAVAAVVAGCGQGQAARGGTEVVKRVAPKVAALIDDAARKAPRVGQRLQPTRAVAAGAEVTATRRAWQMQVDMYRGFCHGWSLLDEYGSLPYGTTWEDIASDAMRQWANQMLQVEVLPAYEETLYALQMGYLTVDAVNSYCALA